MNRRRIKTGLAAVLLCVAIGCGGRPPTTRHEVLAGTIESIAANSGQLTLRPIAARSAEHDDPKVMYLLTNDTEIYVNDRWHNAQDLMVGDHVELIGYRETDPRGEHFVVSLANVKRVAPPPAGPDLLPPASQPQPSDRRTPDGQHPAD